MKIAVCIPTRKRPRLLIAAITALEQLASGENEIIFSVRVDDDDVAGRMALDTLQQELPVTVVVDKAPPTVGQKLNEAVAAVQADAYFLSTDDIFPMTAGWDRGIATVIEEHRLHAFCFNHLQEPGNTTYPVLSAKWMDTLGQAVPELFPFWFTDTWLAEVYHMAFGTGMPIVQDLMLSGQRGRTTGLRDLRFWFDYFEATYPLRRDQARRLAKALHADVTLEQVTEAQRQHHERYLSQLERIPLYEKAFGEPMFEAMPDGAYAGLKQQAQAWMENQFQEQQRHG